MRKSGLLIIACITSILILSSCEKEELFQNESYIENYSSNNSFNGPRYASVVSATRDTRWLTSISYNVATATGDILTTKSPDNFISSKLVLSSLTAGPSDANRFWHYGKTSLTEEDALAVTGDFDLGSVLQDCGDPPGVKHTALFDQSIIPGNGPEIFIIHGGLQGTFEILNASGQVALTIDNNSGSPVVVGGSNFTTGWNPAFYLRNNVNYEVQGSGGHGNQQTHILALDIHPEEIDQISGIRFGGGSCNYTYEILGLQPEDVKTPKDKNRDHKIKICKDKGNGTYQLIEVAKASLSAHMDKGACYPDQCFDLHKKMDANCIVMNLSTTKEICNDGIDNDCDPSTPDKCLPIVSQHYKKYWNGRRGTGFHYVNNHCENYYEHGLENWRLPTLEELIGLDQIQALSHVPSGYWLWTSTSTSTIYGHQIILYQKGTGETKTTGGPRVRNLYVRGYSYSVCVHDQ